MGKLTIRIDPDMSARWNKLAADHGIDPAEHIADAVIDRLEELEDYYVVRKRLAEPYETVPHDEAMRLLGLDDVEKSDD